MSLHPKGIRSDFTSTTIVSMPRKRISKGAIAGEGFCLALFPATNCMTIISCGVTSMVTPVNFWTDLEVKGYRSQDLNTFFPMEGNDNEYVYLKALGKDLSKKD